MKARCIGPGLSTVPRPSTVVMSRPSRRRICVTDENGALADFVGAVARVADELGGVRPGRFVAERPTQIIEQSSELLIAERWGEAGHDAAAVAFRGRDSVEDNVDDILRVRPVDRSRERK